MSAEKALPDYNTESYEMPVDEALELARAHHFAGNYVLAERTYKDVLSAVPDHPTANHLLGAMYYQLGNLENAIYFMEESLKISPDEVAYLNNYGSVLNLSGHYGEAISVFEKVLTIDSSNIDALNRLSSTLWQEKDYEGAEKYARQALAVDSANLDATLNFGLSLVKLEKFEDAFALWKQASEEHPGDVRIWSNWANMMRDHKEPLKAKIIADEALKVDPEYPEALNNMGCILMDLGAAEKALEYFEKATNITPKYYQAHYNKALAYADLSLYEQSSIASRYAVDFKDDYVDGYNALSSALVEIGDFERAHFAAQRAVQLQPDSAEGYMNLADVLYSLNRFDDGHAALKESLKRDPNEARSYMKLANIYERLDELDNAIDAIDKAIELEPETPMFLTRKASMLHVGNEVEKALEVIELAIEKAPDMKLAHVTKAETLLAVNRKEEAEVSVRDALAIDDQYPLAYFTLANIKRFESEDDPDLLKMLTLQDHAAKMSLSVVASLNYAIGSAYENIKNYEKAFEHYTIASQARRKAVPYEPETAGELFASVKENYSPENIKEFEGKGSDSDVPVFIVGMPRSGTTLTEQIISSHPDVYGAGELPDLQRARAKFQTVTLENAKQIGDFYVEFAKDRVKEGDYRYISDKMPGNYMNIGLIQCVLPNAKIIHCCRNPMDTALSNFKQNFMVGQFWSYDLEEMGEEYLRYEDMMRYWHKTLPGKILDIHYEDTVSDLETQARKLIDFLGLEWNDACLMPHKQERTVLTASRMQVTKPVYNSSIEKWKRFEQQLQPFVKIVRPDQAL